MPVKDNFSSKNFRAPASAQIQRNRMDTRVQVTQSRVNRAVTGDARQGRQGGRTDYQPKMAFA